jgi:hypothetical protein
VRQSINYAKTKLNTHVSDPLPVSSYQDAQARSHDRASAGETGVVGRLPAAARRQPARHLTREHRLPVDDDESDGAQADEKPLAESRVCVGLGSLHAGAERGSDPRGNL